MPKVSHCSFLINNLPPFLFLHILPPSSQLYSSITPSSSVLVYIYILQHAGSIRWTELSFVYIFSYNNFNMLLNQKQLFSLNIKGKLPTLSTYYHFLSFTTVKFHSFPQ